MNDRAYLVVHVGAHRLALPADRILAVDPTDAGEPRDLLAELGLEPDGLEPRHRVLTCGGEHFVVARRIGIESGTPVGLTSFVEPLVRGRFDGAVELRDGLGWQVALGAAQEEGV